MNAPHPNAIHHSIQVPCPGCGQILKVPPNRLKRLKNNTKIYCSKKCRYDVERFGLHNIKNFYTIDENGRWNWTGRLDDFGYGDLDYKNKHHKAHRVSFMLHNSLDKIPDDVEIMHSCDNRKCINYQHLSMGTHSENMRDCKNKGRAARGELSGRAKLTEEQVREIFKLKWSGEKSVRQLAKDFQMGTSTINVICNGKSWKHLNLLERLNPVADS